MLPDHVSNPGSLTYESEALPMWLGLMFFMKNTLKAGFALQCTTSTFGINLQKDSRGGQVVRWPWVNFQCRGVLQFGLE